MIFRENRDDAGRLLTLALKGKRQSWEESELRSLYRTLGSSTTREVARLNWAEPHVGTGLAQVLSEDELEVSWKAMLEDNDLRVSAFLDTMQEVVAQLEAGQCPTISVESAGVMLQTQMPFSGLCSHDADLLARGSDMPTINKVLEKAGFEPQNRRGFKMPLVEFARHEDDGTTTWVNIGHEAFDRMWTPLFYSNRNAVWLERRIESPRRSGVFVPDCADALAHVSMHTSFHSFVRSPGIRLHTDVDRLVRDCSIDWERYIGEVLSMGVPTRAFVSLSMAAGLLGTPVPKDVLRELYPGRSRWAPIELLLRSSGSMNNGRRKLGKVKTALLDALLDERGFIPWARSTVFPPGDWMHGHFGAGFEGTKVGLWRLHGERLKALATKWQPG